MPKLSARLVGIELYFDDLAGAKRFYEETLGLLLTGEQTGHHAQFNAGSAFICVEKKGIEDYPSRDKAVVFLEVQNLKDAVESIGREHIIRYEPDKDGGRSWAVLHDPEDHNVLLLQKS
jgi:predicted enzyme related to lactoylglutathione lyase